jgi:hypothetical protein
MITEQNTGSEVPYIEQIDMKTPTKKRDTFDIAY